MSQRLHILLDDETEAKLNRLQKQLRCNRTELVKRCISLSHDMLKYEMKGGRYVTIDPETIVEMSNDRTKVFMPSITLQRIVE